MNNVKDVYNAGCHSIDVTPPVGVFLAGYGGRDKPSDGVYHPLRAVSTVIDDGRSPFLLLSIDWLGFYERTSEARRRIAAVTGIEPERMLLSGTHTHCGPTLRRNIDERRHGKIDEDYIDRSLDALAQSVAEAQRRMVPVRMRSGTGWCGFAASRRRPDEEGGVYYKPSLDAPHDHEVAILIVEDVAGRPLQILFSYSCHPISAGPITKIGGDWAAYACDYLEDVYPGATASFFQGCAGDQKVNVRGDDGDGWRDMSLDEVKSLGERLGRSVRRVVESGELMLVNGMPTVTQTVLNLRCESVAEGELRAASTASAMHLREWAEHHRELKKRGESASRMNFEVQTIRFGDTLLIIALAGEMNVEYALKFKSQWGSKFNQVIVLGYVNDIVGYVPVRRQISEGGYEVVDNHRHQLYSGPFQGSTEADIVRVVTRDVNGE